jgi:hypothetical protein
MTAKQRVQAEQDMLERVVDRISRIPREELIAQLEAYDREEDDPPLVFLGPGSGSVFVGKNGSKPHRDASNT